MEMTYNNNILLLPKQKQTIEKGFDDAFQITDLPYTPCHNCCYTLECSSYKPDTKFQIILI